MHGVGDLPLCSATCRPGTVCSPVHLAALSDLLCPAAHPAAGACSRGCWRGSAASSRRKPLMPCFRTQPTTSSTGRLGCAVQPAALVDEPVGTNSNHHGKEGSVHWHTAHLATAAVTPPSCRTSRSLYTAGAAQRWATRSGPASRMPAPDRLPVSRFGELGLIAVCRSVQHVALCLAAPNA